MKIGSKPHGEQTALMMIGIEKILSTIPLKAILVYGDTNSALAGALAGSKFHDVCVIHLEAGLRSFEIKMPEETNRKAIDHISDILITTTTIAKNFLIKEIWKKKYNSLKILKKLVWTLLRFLPIQLLEEKLINSH